MDKLTTGCASLDRLVKGGFPMQQISFVYGEASTGKTILCMQCAIEAAVKGFKVYYLDSDQSFTPNRLESMLVSLEAAERIVVFRPEDFQDQAGITETMEALLTRNSTLLVIDSVTGLYRAGLGKPREVFAYNRELNRQLAYLADLAHRFPLGILLTGEVHSQPGPGEWTVEPVATRALRHWSRLILRLRHSLRGDVREGILEKVEGREVAGPRSLFKITEIGIEDA